MIVVMLIITQTLICTCTCTFVVGYSIAKSARTSGHDDQFEFLNDEVLRMQCQKQLTLPDIHIKLIVQHFVATFSYRSWHA